MRISKILAALLVGGSLLEVNLEAASSELETLEKTFHTLPVSSRTQTGPLFWLHGNESREKIFEYVEKIAQGGNGTFTAESRPHNDWLGPRWFEDLTYCLEAAKKHGLKMWIFDEKWWPSGEAGGLVPEEYRTKWIESQCYPVASGTTLRVPIQKPERFIGALASQSNFDENREEFISTSVRDITEIIRSEGVWTAPGKDWKVITFSFAPNTEGPLVVDGLSPEAVDWYIQKVYQPHYEHFKDEFGKTIEGFFFDEPETLGDYGAGILPELKRRGIDWKLALMAWKYQLEKGAQIPYQYAYWEVLSQSWGKIFYETLTQWCEERGVQSIGHWLEHQDKYRQLKTCAGNMFDLMRYQSLPGIDAVFTQFKWGEREVYDAPTWQTPKMASSVSHLYGRRDDLAMVEIFGARGQDISYPEMKWWCDAMQVAGINFMIPHSFNPMSPYDQDCPPYFYNNGFEPRWPLYRLWSDYTSRLSVLLSGGHHVCDIALLYPGYSFHVGKVTPPEAMSELLQDMLYDCDWVPYDALLERLKIKDGCLNYRGERYKMLVVPPIEVIPCEVLARVKKFYEKGGKVLGYEFLPTVSASLGKGDKEIQKLRTGIWGESIFNDVTLNENSSGGQAWFMKKLGKENAKELEDVLSRAGVEPALKVLEGETGNWVHALHRVKEGMDVFFIANQNCDEAERRLKVRLPAKEGYPEIWDAMRNEISAVPYQRIQDGFADLELKLHPNESVVIVFNPKKRELPPWKGEGSLSRGWMLKNLSEEEQVKALPDFSSLSWVWYPEELNWIWYPEGDDPVKKAPVGKRYFRKQFSFERAERVVKEVSFLCAADNRFKVYLNGEEVGHGDDHKNVNLSRIRIELLKKENLLAIEAENIRTDSQPDGSPAGLIGHLVIRFEDESWISIPIDKTWKTADKEELNWNQLSLDDQGWASVRVLGKLGMKPWNETVCKYPTLSPVKSAKAFLARWSRPEDCALDSNMRVYLCAESIPVEGAARITINQQDAGGFIGAPYRLEISKFLKADGENEIRIEPFAPAKVELKIIERF